jgi:alkaline phosphatase
MTGSAQSRSVQWIKHWFLGAAVLLFSLLVGCKEAEISSAASIFSDAPPVKYILVMIGDGQGANQIQAANRYTGQIPQHQTWPVHWMTTYEAGGSYDPQQAWSDFNYLMAAPTDSASAATAMFTGVKTANGRISVSADGQSRLFAITENAHRSGRSVGVVTSVYLSHATPGAWMAHNTWRSNGFAIVDEGLWGDPNTTGTTATDATYDGGHGPTLPPMDVVIGAGHPAWGSSTYVNQVMREKLAAESGLPGAFVFVERLADSPDGGPRLLNAASNSTVTRLAGLFGGTGGNLDFRLADGSGYDPENPTLAQMTAAALQVLSRDPDGFILLIEGGAIDWAAHSNDMNRMLGEVIDFNQAVQTVIDWVEAPDNDSDWNNTLVLVTGDHETGYLTSGPGQFPQQPLGEVSPRTLTLERALSGSSLRASWEDIDNDLVIDPGETVYWAWNSRDHTNSLIPLYAQGAGAELLDGYQVNDDPVRGAYLDNTRLYAVMALAISGNYIYLPLIGK